MFSKRLDNFLPFSEIWNCRLQTLSVWKSLKFVIWERVIRQDCMLWKGLLIGFEQGLGYYYEIPDHVSVHTHWLFGSILHQELSNPKEVMITFPKNFVNLIIKIQKAY